MRKANKKTVAVMAVVVCLVLTAYACRFLGNSGFYPKDMGILRSFIYMSLYVAWVFPYITILFRNRSEVF
ncbi:MAG: hypothetical protein ACI4EN_03825 [Butyrivibrio sp.]